MLDWKGKLQDSGEANMGMIEVFFERDEWRRKAEEAEAEVERLKVSRKEAWDEVQRRADENIKLLDELKAAIGILCLATKPPSSSPSSGP
jgi:uncharacterized coiled-coil DUF342 family protein